jgi:hypothetical protein
VDERGSVFLTLAVLLFGSVLMLGLAVDLARVAAAWREASHLAATAAEAGAGWIDADAALDDRLVVHPTRARQAAAAVAAGPDRSHVIATQPSRVCVSVSLPVAPTILAVIGAVPATVTASACAEPRKG